METCTICCMLPWVCTSLLSLLGCLLRTIALCTARIRDAVSGSALPGFPGPPGLPLLGHILQLNWLDPRADFHRLHEEYGGVFGLRLGRLVALVVSDPGAVREVLVTRGADYAGRMESYRTEVAGIHRAIILSQPGAAWKTLKRHTIKGMVEVTKAGRIESACAALADDISQSLRQHACAEFDLKPALYMANFRYMVDATFGPAFSENSDHMAQLSKLATAAYDISQTVTEGPILDAVPWCRHLPGSPGSIYRRLKEFSAVRETTTRYLERAMGTTQEERDSLGATLYALKAARGDLDVTAEDVDATIVMHLLTGVTTTTATMYAFVNILLHHPHVHRKLVVEARGALRGGRVTLAHRDAMPYLAATINETLRYTSVVPLLVPHRALRDTRLAGRPVPEGTLVFVNAWSLHRDPDVYPAPWRFSPERFLDEEGRLVPAEHPARRNLLAFGAGPRACVGQVEARARLFLVLAALLRDWRLREGSLTAPCEPQHYVPGVFFSSPPFTVIAEPAEAVPGAQHTEGAPDTHHTVGAPDTQLTEGGPDTQLLRGARAHSILRGYNTPRRTRTHSTLRGTRLIEY